MSYSGRSQGQIKRMRSPPSGDHHHHHQHRGSLRSQQYSQWNRQSSDGSNPRESTYSGSRSGMAQGGGVSNPVASTEGSTPEDVYDSLCDYHDSSANGGGSEAGSVMLPPGWEKVVYQGSIVYVDHISREAHQEAPWEVWRRRAFASK